LLYQIDLGEVLARRVDFGVVEFSLSLTQ